jgi:hypothetical protein
MGEEEEGAKDILYLSHHLSVGSGYEADNSIILSNNQFVKNVS